MALIMSNMNLACTQLIDQGHLKDWKRDTTIAPNQATANAADLHALIQLLLRCLEAFRHLHSTYMRLRTEGAHIDLIVKELALLQSTMPLTPDLEEKTRNDTLQKEDLPWHPSKLKRRRHNLLEKSNSLTDDKKQLHNLIRRIASHPNESLPQKFLKLASSIISDEKARNRLNIS